MAAISVQVLTDQGLNPSTDGTAAEAGGDTIQTTSPRLKILFYNGDVDSTTITIPTTTTVGGNDIDDLTIAVPAGECVVSGNLQVGLYADSAGLINLSYSDETALQVLPFIDGV